MKEQNRKKMAFTDIIIIDKIDQGRAMKQNIFESIHILNFQDKTTV